LGVLAEASAETKPFVWGFMEQRAFEAAKAYTAACALSSRVPLNYGPGADPIWVMTDACGNGVGGVVAQGKDWRTAKVAAFYSAKMSSAQRNYPVHEQELLAGVETMLRHRDVLQGAKFTWVTDHKILEHVLTQKGLSGRQARWLEKLSEFDFGVQYIPGEENVLPDALSRIYEFDVPGTQHALTEFVLHDDDVPIAGSGDVAVLSAPVLVGEEAVAASPRCSSRLVDKPRPVGVSKPPRQWPAPRTIPERAPEPIPAPAAPPAISPRVTPHGSVEAGAVPLKCVRHPREAPPPAETGRPETGAEFACRMAGRFILLGPGERKKGGEGAKNSPDSSPTVTDNVQSGITPLPTTGDDGERQSHGMNDIPVTYPHESGLLREAKNQYSKDPFYKQILDSPKVFKNFEVADGFIRLHLHDRTVFCVPDIRVGDRRLQEAVIDQAHSLLAHLRARKTLSYL